MAAISLEFGLDSTSDKRKRVSHACSSCQRSHLSCDHGATRHLYKTLSAFLPVTPLGGELMIIPVGGSNETNDALWPRGIHFGNFSLLAALPTYLVYMPFFFGIGISVLFLCS